MKTNTTLPHFSKDKSSVKLTGGCWGVCQWRFVDWLGGQLPFSAFVSRASSLWSDYYYESHDEGLQKLFPQLGVLQTLYLLTDREHNTFLSLRVLEKEATVFMFIVVIIIFWFLINFDNIFGPDWSSFFSLQLVYHNALDQINGDKMNSTSSLTSSSIEIIQWFWFN